MYSKSIKLEIMRQPYYIKIWNVNDNGEKLLKELHFENKDDFISMLNIFNNKNDLEIYDWCFGYCLFTELNGKQYFVEV